jgi:hypothetical protein
LSGIIYFHHTNQAIAAAAPADGLLKPVPTISSPFFLVKPTGEKMKWCKTLI